MLRTIRNLGIPTDDMLQFYKSFILPRLCYASPILSFSLNFTHRKRVQNIQKRAFRIILGLSYTNFQEAGTLLNVSTLSYIHEEHLESARKLLKNRRRWQVITPRAPSPLWHFGHFSRILPVSSTNWSWHSQCHSYHHHCAKKIS